jgi:hypothetical protein
MDEYSFYGWKILLANSVKLFRAPVGAAECSRRLSEAQPPELA